MPDPKNQKPYDLLDRELFRFTDYDPWTGRMAAEGTIIFGSPGGGKTSVVGANLARQILKAIPRIGMLILTAKLSEVQRWIDYAKECGRWDDVVLFSRESGLRYDPLAAEWNSGAGGDIEAIIEMFSLLLSVGKPKGSNHDPFWERSAEQLMRNVIRLLALAKEIPSISNMHRFVQTMPTEPMEEEEFEAWAHKDGNYCGEILSRVLEAKESLSEEEWHDAQIAFTYAAEKWPNLASETRGSIEMQWSGMADRLVFDPFHRIFSSGHCDFNAADCTDRHKIVIVAWPLVVHGMETGMIVNSIIKLSFQRQWLRRKAPEGSSLTCLWIDEAAMFLTPGNGGVSKESQFQGLCREARIIPIYIVQSALSLAEAWGESSLGTKTKTFLSNIRTKIFLQQNDVDTNNLAADLIGKSLQDIDSGNTRMGEGSHGWSQQLHYRVPPSDFSELRKPTGDWFACDAIVYQGGQPFYGTAALNGGVPLNYVRLTFQGR